MCAGTSSIASGASCAPPMSALYVLACVHPSRIVSSTPGSPAMTAQYVSMRRFCQPGSPAVMAFQSSARVSRWCFGVTPDGVRWNTYSSPAYLASSGIT